MQPSMVDETVNYVNASLGLDIGASPALADASASSNTSVPKSIFVETHRPRRASISSGHIAKATAAVAALQEQQKQRHGSHRSESEHTRLVEGACRHIAEAAAQAAVAAVKDNDVQVEEDSRRKVVKIQRKRRRGGILGFKELAAKSGLSPWHFHRVFRSITGLTPKAYGDACWKAVTNKLSDPELLTNIKEEHGVSTKTEMEPPKENHSASVTPQHTPTMAQSLPTPSYPFEPVTPFEAAPAMTSNPMPQFDNTPFESMSYEPPFETCSSMTSPESTMSFDVPFMSPLANNATLTAPASAVFNTQQQYYYDWYQMPSEVPNMPIGTPTTQPSFTLDIPDNMSDSTATQPMSCHSASSASSLLDSVHTPGEEFKDEMASWIDTKDTFTVDQNPSYVDMGFQ
ncbi:YALI0F18458p [Yarrowia lipolytica CLIB122]|uniref:YALI0F18458p n=1 Tax=Yarrowia lipolytica (strain CLIB 122 / E 150) TaxID=284591 RepID=Q6C183_YARLI|nr:YALI0F18458p [Yarrowia lipolytica CLIB122]CAG78388.1 YALI0F18458p [Yarrowia lipolytica CLIB122]|eukprot:XP_505579.1 YALI0F18458p [Yarrowia lipolytica CLIB122]